MIDRYGAFLSENENCKAVRSLTDDLESKVRLRN